MSRRRLMALLGFVVALGIAGVAVAIGSSGSPPRRRATATTAATTTTMVTTTTVAPTTVVAPPSTAAPPATVSPATAPLSTGPLSSLAGRTITIDPGHDGGNYAHSAEISRPIFIGTQTRACDTTGTQANDGYTEAAYNLDVALVLQSVLQSAGAH